VTIGAHDEVRQAVALLNEHRISQLPVVSAHDPSAVVGSISERGLLRHVIEDPALLSAKVVDMMSSPFPGVAASDLIEEAVGLLAGNHEALLVTLAGRPAGILTRADLLEALAR
jgi:cystathionine beta-synthase